MPSAGEWGGLITARWNAVGSGTSSATYDANDGLSYVYNDNVGMKFMNDVLLPFAGYRSYGSASSINYQGSYGYYWSSSPDSTYARHLSLYSSYVYAYNSSSRADGFSVRCFKDS
ncbi:MAG: fibrobacter succinogenes major paralogous domain-containing protein [Candidatus Peribacteria bacterium]|nr:fibrobacter succinogenes major paralogous domain-containing protein [Candidatus Peribacteria bacterium]